MRPRAIPAIRISILAGLLILGATPGLAREGRAQIRAGEIDDECTVQLPGALRVPRYERGRHKRGAPVSLPLSKGVTVKLVSTVDHTVDKRRASYYIYRWTQGRRTQHFVLDRPVLLRTRYNGVWRRLFLLPTPKAGRRGDPPELVTTLTVVR